MPLRDRRTTGGREFPHRIRTPPAAAGHHGGTLGDSPDVRLHRLGGGRGGPSQAEITAERVALVQALIAELQKRDLGQSVEGSTNSTSGAGSTLQVARDAEFHTRGRHGSTLASRADSQARPAQLET
jgi:hypothetical protein